MKKLRQIKNNSILLCCVLLFTQSIFAQTVEKWFVNMPDGLNPTLSKQNRLELLEYYKAGQGDSVTNRYGNQARLVVFDSINQCVVVKNTSSTTFEMKMFNFEASSTVIGLISTVCAPVCQSYIQFYDTAWNSIPIQFAMPKAIEWMNKDSLENKNLDKQWVGNVLENSFITLTFNAANNTIIAQNNSLKFMTEIDRKLFQPLMNEKPFVYKLNGRTWVQQP
jgi:hypothetical protein